MSTPAGSPFARRIGFMQGRLSPVVGGRIQAFPWEHWRQEFALAGRLGFPLMEWTLDQERLRENPLLTPEGRREIRALVDEHGVQVLSLTGDCFMQAPFYKASGAERQERLDDFQAVIEACAEVGIGCLVFPLVDNGRVETAAQGEDLLRGLDAVASVLWDAGAWIAFESDFEPGDLARFLEQMPADRFGVNYDIGNSASLGYDPRQEIASYGRRILNVHVKDRMRKGTTVPLGTGNADFPVVFEALTRAGYPGRYVLQTARAADGDHAGALLRYRDQVMRWLGAA